MNYKKMFLSVYLPLAAMLAASSQSGENRQGTLLMDYYRGNGVSQYGNRIPRFIAPRQRYSPPPPLPAPMLPPKVKGRPPPSAPMYPNVPPTQPIPASMPTPSPFPPSARAPQSEYSAPKVQFAPPGGGSLKHNGGYAGSYQNFVPIVKFNHQMQPEVGQYDVEFLAGNGIYQQESGYMKILPYAGKPYGGYTDSGLASVKTGSVSWTSPEGIPVSFSYIADEHGYRPYGSHIYAAAHEAQNPGHVDSYNNPIGENYYGMNSAPYETLAPNY